LIAAILEHRPAPASALQPLAFPLLDRLIERCLAKDPAERWESAHDIADELRWIAQRLSPREAGAIRRTRRWGWISASAAVVAVLTLATVGWLVTRSEAPAELSVVRLTTYLGEESSPSFSPDGTKVAFSWSQEDNTDIYVKQIGSAGPPMRLTSSPASDQAPAWSPDDRWIAFTRQARGQPRQDVLLVSPLGGPERKLAETRWQVFCWTPDGKWIVMGDVDTEERLAIWAVGVETGERRRLTAPLRAGRGQGRPSGDADGAVSPDGRTLAFSRGPAWIRDLYVMPLTGDMRPAGEPARITKKHYGMVNGVVWMPDGREILYGAGSFNAQSLWRVPVSGKQAPRRLPFAVPGEAFLPAIAHRTSRLAYTWRTLNINLWRLDIRTGERRSVVQSTYDSRFPQYSPDGRRIAFQSGRSGDVEVWACDADGSNCQQLTSFGGPQCGSPRWSPDGRWLALDGANEGWFEVYVIAADGGSPRRLTIGSGVGNNRPSWSRDGQWVYFDSNRSGQRDIWKIPASGGQAVQVTRSGGEAAQPSPDGKYIYYVKPRSDSWSSLFRAPAEGGEERQVVPALVDWHFAVTANAVYFFNEDSLQQLDLATGRISTLAPVPAPWGISASSDGRYVLWAQIDRRTTDLMLVENFR
jgi:Tol biopolymer transport system component